MKVKIIKLKEDDDWKCDGCWSRRARYKVVVRCGKNETNYYLCKQHLKFLKSMCEKILKEMKKLGVRK